MYNTNLTNLLKDENLFKLESMLEEFNLFEILGIQTREEIHSNFLAWILNPSENHGLGDKILKEFLKRAEVTNILDIECENYSDIIVEKEIMIDDNSRLDILLYNTDKTFMCVIENKIKAQEGIKQLKRYRNTISEKYVEYKNKYFIFLTPDGREAKTDDASHWNCIGYDEIEYLLKIIISSYSDRLPSHIMSFIRQYYAILQRQITGSNKIYSELLETVYSKHSAIVKELTAIKNNYQTIFEQHKESFGLLKGYNDNIELRTNNFIKNFLKTDNLWKNEVRIVRTDKDYVNFIPKQFADMTRLQGANKNWYKFEQYVSFEVKKMKDGLTLRFLLGPTEENIEVRTFLKQKFTNDNSRYWNTITNSESTLLNNSELDEKVPQETRERILTERLSKYKETYSKLVKEISDAITEYNVQSTSEVKNNPASV